MIPFLLPLSFAGTAAAVEPPLEESSVPAAEAVSLKWRTETVGETLVVRYELHNAGRRPVWVLDQWLNFAQEGGFVVANRAAVRAVEGQPVRIVAGWLAPEAFPMHLVLPAGRELAPGATVERVVTLPLPLRTWHPNEPLAAAVPGRTATLEVGVMDAAPGEHLVLADGAEVRIPTRAQVQKQRLIRGDPQSF